MRCLCRGKGSRWGLESLSLEVLYVLPGVNPGAEGKGVIDPFFRVASVFIFSRDGFASGEAIWSEVAAGWNVNELEVK